MTSWPRPSALQNSNDPIPTDAPSTQGKPRHTPAADPVATIIVLLGPGVIAATILKIRKAIAWSGVMCGQRLCDETSALPPEADMCGALVSVR